MCIGKRYELFPKCSIQIDETIVAIGREYQFNVETKLSNCLTVFFSFSRWVQRKRAIIDGPENRPKKMMGRKPKKKKFHWEDLEDWIASDRRAF